MTDAKKVAERLRALANEVEKCKVNHYDVCSSQISKQADLDHIDRIRYLKTGEIDFTINLTLYNPKLDDRRRIPEIIREEEQKR